MGYHSSVKLSDLHPLILTLIVHSLHNYPGNAQTERQQLVQTLALCANHVSHYLKAPLCYLFLALPPPYFPGKNGKETDSWHNGISRVIRGKLGEHEKEAWTGWKGSLACTIKSLEGSWFTQPFGLKTVAQL